jgi:hypothetical protein
MHESRMTYNASRYHRPRLLDERIETIIERDGIDSFQLSRPISHLSRVGRIYGKRLIADDVLAAFESIHHDGVMEMIGRADMDDFYGVVRKEFAIIAAGSINRQGVGFLSGRFERGSSDRDHFDIAQPSDGFDMKRPDKTGSYQTCSYFSQATSFV